MRTIHLATWTEHNGTNARTATPDAERATPMAEAVAVAAPPAASHITRLCYRGDRAVDMPCCDESRQNAQRAFDLELAQFAGCSVENETESPPFGSDCLIKCAASRVNSLDGRRKGWLARRSEAGDATDVEVHDIGPSQSVRYWDSIWDGTEESIPK